MTLCLGRIGVEICINGILCFYSLKTNDSKRAVVFASSEALKFRSTLLRTQMLAFLNGSLNVFNAAFQPERTQYAVNSISSLI